MKELTPWQREEQIKILNSLKNGERLKEFRKILEGQSKPEIPVRQRSGAQESPATDTQEQTIPTHSATLPVDKQIGNVNQQEFNLF